MCFLPGVALCRHRLGVASIPRALILGSVLSLCVIPAAIIPPSLLLGRPSHALSVALAAAVTVIAALRGGPREPGEGQAKLDFRPLLLILGLELALQIGLSLAIYPDARTIRWVGLPDLTFFRGIHTQILERTPPLDPDNGGALLIHNWIYHFQFALVDLVTGVPVVVMQRMVSAWVALTFLGLVYLVGADALGSAAAGGIACLFFATSGEVTWLVRSLLSGSLSGASLSWWHMPSGSLLLIGWYNLPPVVVAVAAWYWLERHRKSGRGSDLAASIAMCVALAFFHPISFGVFMVGFCSWMAWLWLKGERRWGRLVYLLTPLPFFVLYKLPYYGTTMPPRVLGVAHGPGEIADNLGTLLLWGAPVLLLGIAGMVVRRDVTGPLPFMALAIFGMELVIETPNPHWFHDLLFVSLAFTSGLAMASLLARRPRAGVALAAGVFSIVGIAFALQVRQSLRYEHTFSDEELAAVAWMTENSGPDDLVSIFPNSPSGYAMEGLAGRRLVLGWTRHELDFHADAKQRERDVEEMYRTADARRAAQLAAQLGVNFVYVGKYERKMGDGPSMPSECFESVFERAPVRIYRFTCPRASS
ncbi:MAG: hypothetical protein HY049_09540 [Acidobacteria bacterium]|nr:hypothetical protein [Acidobacteriota bacterium]